MLFARWAGGDEVVRDRGRVGLRAGEGLPQAAVQAGLAGGGDRGEHRVADQVVHEPELARAALLQVSVAAELLDRVEDLVAASRQTGLDGGQLEGGSCDCAEYEQRGQLGVEGAEPAFEEPGDRGRHRVRVERASRVFGFADQLGHIQRVAGGAGGDGGAHRVGAAGQVDAAGVEELGHFADGEPLEPQRRRGNQPVDLSQRARDGRWRLPEDQHDEARTVGQASHDVAEQGQRVPVGPVQVVDDHEQRSVGREAQRGAHRAKQPRGGLLRRHRHRVVGAGHEVGHERREVRGDGAQAFQHLRAGADELADRVGERTVRDADQRVTATPEDRGAALLGRVGGFEDEPGLADAGFALDDDDLAASVAGAPTQLGEGRDLGPPADEQARRTAGGAAGRPRRVVEGQPGWRAEQTPVRVLGLTGWADTELGVEEAAQGLVRGERRGPIPRLLPRGHQQPGRLLLDRIPLQRGAGQLDCIRAPAGAERSGGRGVQRPPGERPNPVAPVEHPHRVSRAEERMPKRVERGSGEPGGGGPVAAFDETFGVEHLTEGPFDVHVELVGDLEAGHPVRRGQHVGGQAGLNQNPPGPRHHLAGHSFPTVWVRLGPEELDELFAQQRPGALQHQEGEDQRRLGPPNLDWLTSGGLDHRPTEKTDLHRRVPHLVRPPTRATLGLAPA